MTERTPQVTKSPTLPVVISGTQVMFAVIVMVILMLAINFGGRVSADRELNKVRDAVTAEIDALRREQAELVRRLEYVKSDAYVEVWARSDGRMVRENDVLIVPVPALGGVADTPASPTPFFTSEVAQPTPVWQLWWALFFDTPPPQF